MRATDARRQGLHTSGALDLQDTLFSSGILKCVEKGRLDREEGPLGVGWRARARDGGIDDALVAALDRRTVRREVEGRHDEGQVR